LNCRRFSLTDRWRLVIINFEWQSVVRKPMPDQRCPSIKK
jgi:hypothetical protein